jgi:hypothetical protein
VSEADALLVSVVPLLEPVSVASVLCVAFVSVELELLVASDVTGVLASVEVFVDVDPLASPVDGVLVDVSVDVLVLVAVLDVPVDPAESLVVFVAPLPCAAPARSASSCAFVTHVSPVASETQSLSVCTSPAKNDVMPLVESANHCTSRAKSREKKVSADELDPVVDAVVVAAKSSASMANAP